ncbi:MAG: T9SS type A sorting domain-containing protein [Saprospiraceae bacterium]
MFTGLAPGTYTVVTSNVGTATCSDTKTITINAAAATCNITSSLAKTDETAFGANDGTITVTASCSGTCGTLQYALNGGAPQASNLFTGLAPGTYTVVTSNVGTATCSDTKTITINAAAACTPPVITAPTVTQSTCTTPTGTIVVNATGGPGPLEYSVDNGASWQASNTFSGLNPGSYNIKVRLQNDPTCMAAYVQNPVVLSAAPGQTYNGNVYFSTQAQLNAWSSCYTIINGSVSIIGAGINNLVPLSNIVQITGNLTIQSTGLTNMDGLDGLTTLGTTLTIVFNNSLATMDGLGNLATVGGPFYMYYNFQLANCCAIHGLINGGVAGPVAIFFNKVGCNSVTEINNNCTPSSPIVAAPNNNSIHVAQGISQKKALTLYPNPTKGKVTVQVQERFETGTLRILDFTGRTVLNQQLMGNNLEQVVNVEGLETGIYLVQVQMDGQVINRKLMIE